MISYLRGQVLRTARQTLTLLVGGVGYAVQVNTHLLGSSGELELFIHTHQTSDTISLFGFATVAELEIFELLNSVNGVGPKTALEILEQPADRIRQIVAAGDAKTLSQIKGIGPKTAARIILELKSKITRSAVEVPVMPEVSPEVFTALMGLGYKSKQIEKVLIKLPPELTETTEIVTWFLRAV